MICFTTTSMAEKEALCTFCKYNWKPRVPSPKACPRCKNRLDYQRKRTVDVRTMLDEVGKNE